MGKFTLKNIAITAILLMAFAPIAQASTATFSVPACMASMMASHASNCCASHCDCAIQAPSDGMSAILPASIETRVELIAAELESQGSDAQVEPVVSEKSAAESPPAEDPLYQLYSDYRL